MILNFTKAKKNSRDENALEILFDDYYEMVYRTAFSIVFDTELAKKATQEAFIKAFNKIDTLRDKSKFGSWVRAITVNVCKDMLKRIIVNRKNCMSIYDSEGNLREYIQELGDLNTPESIYRNTEMRHELKYCISQLDANTQIIINLKYYHDFTYKEIAEILGMKEGTVKTKLHRAQAKIARSLEKYFDVKGVENNV